MNDWRGGTRPAAGWVWSSESAPIDVWRDVVCGIYPGLSIDWLDDRPKCGWLETGAFADAQLAGFANTPMRVTCARSPPRCDAFDLALLLDGHAYSRHARRTEAWQHGDLMLFDSALPFEVVHPTSYRLLIWRLPREVLAPLLAAPERAVGRRIRGRDGPGAVLAAYARALMNKADGLDATTQRSLLTHLCGLIALVLGAGREARESRRESYRVARRQQILTYIETHLRDPRLTAERAARELGMSRRWLYALLDETGESFAALVARRRIKESRSFLNDPAHDHQSIAEIAFLSGFNNLSTFNRGFRAQYEMTPRDARRLRARRPRRSVPAR